MTSSLKIFRSSPGVRTTLKKMLSGMGNHILTIEDPPDFSVDMRLVHFQAWLTSLWAQLLDPVWDDLTPSDFVHAATGTVIRGTPGQREGMDIWSVYADMVFVGEVPRRTDQVRRDMAQALHPDQVVIWEGWRRWVVGELCRQGAAPGSWTWHPDNAACSDFPEVIQLHPPAAYAQDLRAISLVGQDKRFSLHMRSRIDLAWTLPTLVEVPATGHARLHAIERGRVA